MWKTCLDHNFAPIAHRRLAHRRCYVLQPPFPLYHIAVILLSSFLYWSFSVLFCPVISHFNEQAVGEYFLASAFEKVLVQKSGYVGLNGISQQKLFFRGFFDKYGIKPEIFAREVGG